ncbi:MAG: VOC family protein [Acidobacteria bacterium]|nr:VOC family protein [Acidobacteriota bacterium]
MSVHAKRILGFGALFTSLLTAQTRLHHIHLNSTDPERAASFYAAKFEAERKPYQGQPAVWANGSWLLFNKTGDPPKSAITSGIWHIGWGGGDDMKRTYQNQLAMSTRFQTPLTDLSDQCDGKGGNEKFLFAYVDGPDHALIELNTTPAGNHRFGHLHLLSTDPIKTAEWYVKHFDLKVRAMNREPRSRCGRPTAPSASLLIGDISFIIYPLGNAKAAFPDVWKDRNEIESSAGHAIDHFALTVPDLKQALSRIGAKPLRVSAKSALIEGPDKVLIELLEE